MRCSKQCDLQEFVYFDVTLDLLYTVYFSNLSSRAILQFSEKLQYVAVISLYWLQSCPGDLTNFSDTIPNAPINNHGDHNRLNKIFFNVLLLLLSESGTSSYSYFNNHSLVFPPVNKHYVWYWGLDLSISFEYSSPIAAWHPRSPLLFCGLWSYHFSVIPARCFLKMSHWITLAISSCLYW